MKKLSLFVSSFFLCLLLTGCEGPPSTPTPTSDPSLLAVEAAIDTPIPTDAPLPTSTDIPTTTYTPISTDIPDPTATNTPTPMPTLFPTPEVPNLRLADFLTCDGMGGVSPGEAPENYLVNECLLGAGRGNFIAQLDYEVPTPTAWAGFRIVLDNADFSAYDTLTFFARGDAEVGIPLAFRLEIKRADGAQVGIFNLAGLSEEWEQYAIPLQELRTVPNSTPICGWDEMEELVFVFEQEFAGEKGRVFLDNVYVESREGEAPEVPDTCPLAAAPPLPPPPLPAPSPPPAPPSLLVADFCTGTNSLGGAMGAAYNGANSLTENYGAHADQSCAVRLEYNIQEWAAFWMMLNGQDLTPYSRLLFDIKGDPAVGIPGQIKIELKRAGNTEVSIVYVSNITDSWQTRSVSLDSFRATGFPGVPPLSALTGIDELVFTFEANVSGNVGLVYLDQVRFQP